MQQCLKFIYTGSIDPNSYNMQVTRLVSSVLENVCHSVSQQS